jgi:hypothetical protein
MTTPSGPRRFLFPKLGLKLLAVLLGVMAWYLIQDAIRLEAAQRKASFEPRHPAAATNSAVRLERLPVTVLSRPGVWDWRLDPPVVASVWIEGSDADLNRLELTTVRVFVDGSVITQPGEYAMPVRVYLSGDVKLKTATDPALVRVTFKPAVKGGP